MRPSRFWLTRNAKAPKPAEPALVARCVDGELPVRAALDLADDWLVAARERALDLYAVGKWADCVAIIEGLVALGSQNPVDPVLLSRCYARLGDHARAAEVL